MIRYLRFFPEPGVISGTPPPASTQTLTTESGETLTTESGETLTTES